MACKICKEISIDHSIQAMFQFVKWFQRRLKCVFKAYTNDEEQSRMDNRETRATYWVQDTERRQAKQINTKLKNEQHRPHQNKWWT